MNHPPDSVLGVLRPPKTAEPDRSDERSRFQAQPKALADRVFGPIFYVFMVQKGGEISPFDRNRSKLANLLWGLAQGPLRPPRGGV